MSLADIYSNLLVWSRWVHLLAGMLWIGHVYFYNFVILRSESEASPRFLIQAMSWLRCVASLAVASGFFLLLLAYFYSPTIGFGPTAMLISNGTLTDRAAWVGLGMLLALLMWFQVWFVLFPTQLRLSRGVTRSDEVPTLRLRLRRGSTSVTLLSGPMVFAMLAPSHFGSISWVAVSVALAGGIAFAGSAVPLIGKCIRSGLVIGPER